MPRAHTPEEQAAIRATLLEVGEARFAEVGLDGVSIAELARAAGIGKGTFYHYFDSKEALFFTIQERLEQDFRQDLVRALEPLLDQPETLVETFVVAHVTALERHAFLRHLAQPEVLQALLERLPPAITQAHQARDRAFYLDLLRGWIEAGALPPSTDPELVFAALAAAYALTLNREIIGARYRDVVAVLARGLARELTAR